MTNADWLVLVRPDGIVETVAGGAPRAWIGAPVDRAFAPFPSLLEALPRLVAESVCDSCVHRTVVSMADGGRDVVVELLLLEAVPIRRSATPIEPLVIRTLDIFLHQARSHDVQLDIRFSRNVPSIAYVDAEKIAWALATLVGGALRHSQQRADRSKPGAIAIDVSWRGEADEIAIAVRDDGPGIPPDRARWLFERDPSTGRAAGLALVMVRDVLAAHRGSITLASQVGQGSEFVMTFPRRVSIPRPVNTIG